MAEFKKKPNSPVYGNLAYDLDALVRERALEEAGRMPEQPRPQPQRRSEPAQRPRQQAAAQPKVQVSPLVLGCVAVLAVMVVALLMGYVKLTQDKVNLRAKPAGSSIEQLPLGQVLPMTGKAQIKNNVTWYPVDYNGQKGYIRGDCAFKLSQTQQDSYLAGLGVPDEEPTPEQKDSTYLKTVLDGVHLREAASKDATSMFNVPKGTVLAYNASTTSGGSTWYRVVYSNTEVWVAGYCISVMTEAEYEQWLSTNPSSTPQPYVAIGYVKTTADDVNLREEANGSVKGRVETKGTVLPYISNPVTIRNVRWYQVQLKDGTRGYLNGGYVKECTSDGSDIVVDEPSDSTGNEATYTTLRLGSSGDAVEKLVEELRNQGYYNGAVTRFYTSAVEDSVRAYQKAKGLSADGIAGPVTQHSLFGTVPEGSGTGDLTMTLYPAEKIDWFTGGIQQLWAKGDNYKVYDVKTGIVWWAHRWSGYYHADIETLTAADTARLCKMYGVSSADQINYTDHWHRRPSLVTIGTHTYACSLDGVPHNPDGDTIANNAMTGQICMHFTNSKGHESKKVSESHQEAIEYAWKNAPNGHK